MFQFLVVSGQSLRTKRLILFACGCKHCLLRARYFMVWPNGSVQKTCQVIRGVDVQDNGTMDSLVKDLGDGILSPLWKAKPPENRRF